MSEEKANPLALVATEAILMELSLRYEHGIFYGVQERSTGKNDPHNVESYRYWGNNVRICQGLCADLVCQINRSFTVDEISSDEL